MQRQHGEYIYTINYVKPQKPDKPKSSTYKEQHHKPLELKSQLLSISNYLFPS